MKKNLIITMLLFLFINFKAFSYSKFSYKIMDNIQIEGFEKFSYAIWLHPLQLNKDLENFLIKPVLENMKKFLKPGMVVIDIGAHTGDTSVAYSLVVGKEGKVIAFEPNFAAYDVLKINAQLNKNIIAVDKAITETDGTFVFHYTDPGLCNGGFAEMLQQGPSAVGNTTLQVQGINLENWLNENFPQLKKKIGFIKIDTEGYDRFILKSISQLITKHRPVIQCEIYPALTVKEKKDFFNLIESLDYNCFVGGIYQDLTKSLTEKLDINSFSHLTGPVDILCLPK